MLQTLIVESKTLQLQKLVDILYLGSWLDLIEHLLWKLIIVIIVVDVLRYYLRLHVEVLLLLSVVQKLRVVEIDLKLVSHLVTKIF